MAATDLGRQFLAENRQFVSCRRANMRRQVSIDGGSAPLGSKEDQLRKLSGGEPGETAAIVSSMEGQTPVTLETVPAQLGDLEKLAAHGLHWVAEEALYFTNLDRHVRCRRDQSLDQSTRQKCDQRDRIRVARRRWMMILTSPFPALKWLAPSWVA